MTKKQWFVVTGISAMSAILFGGGCAPPIGDFILLSLIVDIFEAIGVILSAIADAVEQAIPWVIASIVIILIVLFIINKIDDRLIWGPDSKPSQKNAKPKNPRTNKKSPTKGNTQASKKKTTAAKKTPARSKTKK